MRTSESIFFVSFGKTFIIYARVLINRLKRQAEREEEQRVNSRPKLFSRKTQTRARDTKEGTTFSDDEFIAAVDPEVTRVRRKALIKAEEDRKRYNLAIS